MDEPLCTNKQQEMDYSSVTKEPGGDTRVLWTQSSFRTTSLKQKLATFGDIFTHFKGPGPEKGGGCQMR